MGEENCETLPSDINIIKGQLNKIGVIISVSFQLYLNNISEEYDELGRLQRTCHGEIAVNKCEGTCNSQVQPSVITPTGFLKVIRFDILQCVNFLTQFIIFKEFLIDT